jgi:ferritin-like metal-binding protein YciE
MKRPVKRQANGHAGQESMHVPLLTNFFYDQLKDLYWAEKHIVKSLARMRKASFSDELCMAFEDHLQETKQHAIRIEKIFEFIGLKPQTQKCEGLECLVIVAETVIAETEDGTATRDVGLIFIAQKIEHYEIAAYGSLHQLALTLELDEIAGLLESTLSEEKDLDKQLTIIAKTHVNYDAMEEV